jgi:hypothetical protein
MVTEVQEKWLKWVALTTTILAVCAAIGSLKGGGYSTQVQLMTTRESDKWSYYEAKSIKGHLTDMERDLLKIELLKKDIPTVKDEIQKRIKILEDNSNRYTKEREEIKSQAEALSDQQAGLKRHGGNFGLAVMFFQIAIMLSAIGSLLKQRLTWLFGLAIGIFGLAYFINGFFLLF